jgi:hypothetical protein
MPSSLTSQISWAVLIGIFALALWRGGRPERLGAGFSIAAATFGLVIHDVASPDLAPLLLLAADAILAGAFLFLAVRYASLWLGAAMIFQAVQFALHAIYTASDLRPDNTYKILNNLVTLGIFTVILLATLLSWRKRVRDAKVAATL